MLVSCAMAMLLVAVHDQTHQCGPGSHRPDDEDRSAVGSRVAGRRWSPTCLRTVRRVASVAVLLSVVLVVPHRHQAWIRPALSSVLDQGPAPTSRCSSSTTPRPTTRRESWPRSPAATHGCACTASAPRAGTAAAPRDRTRDLTRGDYVWLLEPTDLPAARRSSGSVTRRSPGTRTSCWSPRSTATCSAGAQPAGAAGRRPVLRDRVVRRDHLARPGRRPEVATSAEVPLATGVSLGPAASGSAARTEPPYGPPAAPGRGPAAVVRRRPVGGLRGLRRAFARARRGRRSRACQAPHWLAAMITDSAAGCWPTLPKPQRSRVLPAHVARSAAHRARSAAARGASPASGSRPSASRCGRLPAYGPSSRSPGPARRSRASARPARRPANAAPWSEARAPRARVRRPCDGGRSTRPGRLRGVLVPRLLVQPARDLREGARAGAGLRGVWVVKPGARGRRCPPASSTSSRAAASTTT